MIIGSQRPRCRPNRPHYQPRRCSTMQIQDKWHLPDPLVSHRGNGQPAPGGSARWLPIGCDSLCTAAAAASSSLADAKRWRTMVPFWYNDRLVTFKNHQKPFCKDTTPQIETLQWSSAARRVQIEWKEAHREQSNVAAPSGAQ